MRVLGWVLPLCYRKHGLLSWLPTAGANDELWFALKVEKELVKE